MGAVNGLDALAQGASPQAAKSLWSAAYGAGNLNGAVSPAAGGVYSLLATRQTPSSGMETVFAELDTTGRVTEAKVIDKGASTDDDLVVNPVQDGFLVNGSIASTSLAESTLVWAKFSDTWNREYSRSFSGPGLFASGGFSSTSDGGMLFVGSASTSNCGYALLLKIGPTGEFTWKSVLQHDCGFSPFEFLEVSDGYLIVGYVISGNPIRHWPVVMKISNAGKLMWAKELTFAAPIPQFDEFTEDGRITQLHDGSVLFTWGVWTGSDVTSERADAAWAVKMDQAGRVEWTKLYQGSYPLQIAPSSVVENALDGTFLLGGLARGGSISGDATVILKVNEATGAIVKTVLIHDAEQHFSYILSNLFKGQSGELYFSGERSRPNHLGTAPGPAWFGQLNPATLIPIWARTFDGGGNNGAATGTETGFLITGDTETYGTNPSGGNVFAATLDKNGTYPGCHVNDSKLATDSPKVTATNPELAETNLPFTAANLGKVSDNVSLPVSAFTLPAAAICRPATVAAAARCER
jgi:hypothetical protein